MEALMLALILILLGAVIATVGLALWSIPAAIVFVGALVMAVGVDLTT